VPGGAGCSAFSSLPLRVSSERDDRALREFERALRLGRLGIAALARRAPDVDHSPIEVYVIPRELAQLAGAQAEGNRDDEQRLEPAVGPTSYGLRWRKGVRAIRAIRRRPWEGELPVDRLTAAPFPKLVISGRHSPAFEAVCVALRLQAQRKARIKVRIRSCPVYAIVLGSLRGRGIPKALLSTARTSAAHQGSGATGSNYCRATTRIYQILSVESLSRILRNRYICPS
jgi:hypothetical protein